MAVAVQLNIAYFSAVEEDEAWYLLARALQFFTPGVPLVYYVGLLAGANDAALVEETGTGRDINRHPYTVPEAEKEMKRPVVKVRDPAAWSERRCLLASIIRAAMQGWVPGVVDSSRSEPGYRIYLDAMMYLSRFARHRLLRIYISSIMIDRSLRPRAACMMSACSVDRWPRSTPGPCCPALLPP